MDLSKVPDEEYVYAYDTYESASITDSLHGAPRGGRETDISLFANTNDEISDDYAYGVAFVPLILVMLFLVWMLLLIMMRFCGNSLNCKSSSKSPAVAARTKEGGPTQEELDAWVKRIRNTRYVAVVMALSSAVVAAIMVGKGLTELDSSVGDFGSDLSSIDDLASEVASRATDLITITTQATDDRDDLLNSAFQFCPGSVEGIVTVVTDDNIDVEVVEVEVDVNFNISLTNFTDSLGLLGDFLTVGTHTVRSNAYEVVEEANEFYEKVDDAETFAYPFALLLFCVYIMLELYVAFAISMTKSEGPNDNPFRLVNRSHVVPALSFTIFLGWLLSACFVYLSVLSADFCYDDVESNTLNITRNFELQWGEFLFDQVAYYVEGCSLEEKPVKPTQFYDDFVKGMNDTDRFANDLLVDLSIVQISDLSIACGSDVSSFINMTMKFQETLGTVEASIIHVQESLYCSNWNPLFVDMVRDSICEPGVNNVAIVSFALITTSILGMSLLTMMMSWEGGYATDVEGLQTSWDEKVDASRDVLDQKSTSKLSSPHSNAVICDEASGDEERVSSHGSAAINRNETIDANNDEKVLEGNPKEETGFLARFGKGRKGETVDNIPPQKDDAAINKEDAPVKKDTEESQPPKKKFAFSFLRGSAKDKKVEEVEDIAQTPIETHIQNGDGVDEVEITANIS